MRKHVRKALSALLVFSMMLAMLPARALAADDIMPYEENDDWERGETIESTSQPSLPIVDEPPADEFVTDEVPLEREEDEPSVAEVIPEEAADLEEEVILEEDEIISTYATYTFGDYTYSLSSEKATITGRSGTEWGAKGFDGLSSGRRRL